MTGFQRNIKPETKSVLSKIWNFGKLPDFVWIAVMIAVLFAITYFSKWETGF